MQVGFFVCDYYLFTWTTTANIGGEGSYVGLYMDDTLLKRLYLTHQTSADATGTSGSSSMSVIKQCSTGSYFQVRGERVDGTTVFLGGYASFAGYKIP